MKTSLDHLPVHKQQELKQIVSVLIPRFQEIEMIILFGSYARGNQVEWDTYVENGTTYDYKSDFDLLVILNKNTLADNHTLTGAMNAAVDSLGFRTPSTLIFHGMHFINTALGDGNYFFKDLKKEGILLFNTSRYQLAEEREHSPAEIQAKAQHDFNAWFKSATMFYGVFESEFEKGSRDKDHYKIAAFQLHQATERYYNAIELVFTGYKPKTHDLLILGKTAQSFDLRFSKVFPQSTPEEITCFELLRKAYVDARYDMDYTISPEQLTYLASRVQMLRTLATDICQAKIISFTDCTV